MMRTAISALGGQANLCRASLPLSMNDIVSGGLAISVRDVDVGAVSNFALRVIIAEPATVQLTPKQFATQMTSALSNEVFTAASVVASAMAKQFTIPANTNDFLTEYLPIFRSLAPLVNQLWAADTSLGVSPAGGVAFVDVVSTATYSPYGFIVKNSTLNCRKNFKIANPAKPLELTYLSDKCAYDASKRNWYQHFTASPGVLQGYKAMASASTGEANLLVGYGYSVPQAAGMAPIVGAMVISMSTTTLSDRITALFAGSPAGAIGVAYEVQTGNVIGVSWPNATLTDLSQYNASATNPVILMKTLTTLTTKPELVAAVKALGGQAALCQAKLPGSMLDSYVGGSEFAVRNVNVAGLANFALRVLIVVPGAKASPAPSVAAPKTSADYATNAVNVFSGDVRNVASSLEQAVSNQWQGIPAQTDDFLTEYLPVYRSLAPLVGQLWAADTSLGTSPGGIAFVDVLTTATYSPYGWLVKNSTLSCRNNFKIADPTKPLELTYLSDKCNYDASKRNWFQHFTASPGTLQGYAAKAGASSGQANLLVGHSYSVPRIGKPDVVGAMVMSMSTKTLSDHLAKLLMGPRNVSGLVYEVATGNVIAVSWGESLIDKSQYDTTQANPLILITSLTTLTNHSVMRSAIAALGGQAKLCASSITSIRDMKQGALNISVRDVDVGAVANFALRVIIVEAPNATNTADTKKTFGGNAATGGKLSGGAIAGIAIGALLVVIIVVLVVAKTASGGASRAAAGPSGVDNMMSEEEHELLMTTQGAPEQSAKINDAQEV
jgi:hypothetical protein